DRKTAAQRFRERHDVGLDAASLISEQFACTPDAGLYFIEDQQQAVLIAELAQSAQERRRDDAHPTFPLNRFNQDRGRRRADRTFDRIEVSERHLIETIDRWAEAFEIFLV